MSAIRQSFQHGRPQRYGLEYDIEPILHQDLISWLRLDFRQSALKPSVQGAGPFRPVLGHQRSAVHEIKDLLAQQLG
jgi:hypothetical protein